MPAYIVIGLGYGDEGKGLVTDYLARQHKASGVVRFNGGAQAAHNVVLPNELHHTFSQFGSGTFSGTPTYLSEHMLVNPHALFVEWEKIYDTWAWPQGLLHVHKDALITTPFHIAANRVREKARGQDQHGTCGMGIGETIMAAKNGFAIRAWELRDFKSLKPKLEELTHHLRLSLIDAIQELPERWNDHEYQVLANPQQIKDAMEIYRIFVKAIPQYSEPPWKEGETWIFEGAQGVLLDEFYGWHPHTTWSNTTPDNARDLLSGSGMEPHVIGVTRSYMTRHGAGPFVTEDQSLWPRFPEAHNNARGYQGAWRIGWTDLVALRYAIEAIDGVDELAVTHLDRVEGDWKICLGYGGPEFPPPTGLVGKRNAWEYERGIALKRLAAAVPEYAEENAMTPSRLLAEIEDVLGMSVDFRSFGPSYLDIRQLAHV